MSDECSVEGAVADALFSLKVHRGEGMALLAMDWKIGQPPPSFVGFAIEYREPQRSAFFPLKNRLSFDGNAGSTPSGSRPPTYSTLIAPIQKFRWVHFPRNADLPGDFTYRVTPVFMSGFGDLSYGVAQIVDITLARETYPGILNVSFTRGFVSSQAFVDRYVQDGALNTLVPGSAKEGMTFTPTHPRSVDAYDWMGFEARREVLSLLDAAAADPAAKVWVIAYDLNLPEIVSRLETLGSRARVIIDDSAEHHGEGASEDVAEARLVAAGVAVKRQHMGKLQHNKIFFIDSPTMKQVICGSANMSWRGLFVQSNNAVAIQGEQAVAVFTAAFEAYWNQPSTFKSSDSAEWMSLGLSEVDASITFSPHRASNSVLKGIADDIRTARSSIFYSLAFLSITPGVIRDALSTQSGRDELFVSGIADQRAGVLVASGSSNLPPTYVAALDSNVPDPFRREPTGLTATNRGTRMHHKFVVVDFDLPGARVYLGSYNMSKAADDSNGENLVLIRDRRVATSYMIEAVRMIDHYEFRVARAAAGSSNAALRLKRPPGPGAQPWWAEDFADPRKIKDRLLFA